MIVFIVTNLNNLKNLKNYKFIIFMAARYIFLSAVIELRVWNITWAKIIAIKGLYRYLG